MDLGLFLPLANNGWIISTTAPQYLPTFEINKKACVDAEQAGFEFALSMVKFRGFGGTTEFWDYAAESLTLMAGLAAATSRIKLYASLACPTLHPAIAARMAVTAQDISGGRFGINIVSGWNKWEYSQMGMWPSDDFYDVRYDYSTEYIEVMRLLWETGRASYQGRYFTLDDCFCKPTPQQRIPIVAAGQSERGMRMVAEVGDYNFVLGGIEELRGMRERLTAAADATGRSVGAYALHGIITAPTDREAVELTQHYLDGTDIGALEGLATMMSADARGTMSKEVLSKIATRPDVVLPEDGLAAVVHGACFHTPQLVGSYERIARHLDALQTRAGMDGVVMTFPDFTTDVRAFSETVMPLMTTRPLSDGRR